MSSGISFSGLSSGLDWDSIVEQLMTIESQRLARYQVDQLACEDKMDAIDELRSNINALKSATSALADTDSMDIYNATSSDNDLLSVSTTDDATPGSHSIDINQLASSETWIQATSTFNYKTDYVGEGVFIYSYNNQECTITTVANETTLEDLVNLINNAEDNPGVTASLLYQSGKYHLMLSGQDTGEDYQITINSSTTEVWEPDEDAPYSIFTKDDDNAGLSTKLVNLDQFSGTLGASDTITISGTSHDGTSLPDTTLAITANTTVGHLIDAINDHYEGVATARLENGQIVLTDNTSGDSELSMNLSYSGDATLGLPTMAVSQEGGQHAGSTLASLDASSFIETQDAQNAKIKIDGYPSGTTDEVQALSFTGGTPTTGTFKLTLNGQTTEAIAYNATAADIQNALLALDGIEAGDIIVSGTDMLTGDIAVQFSGNLAGTDIARMVVSEADTIDAGVISVTETTKGSDGWLSRNSNTITDVLSGVKLMLQGVTEEDDPVAITISRSTDSITDKIKEMVERYNALLEAVAGFCEYDEENKRMGILSTDYGVTSLTNDIRLPFNSAVAGFVDTIDSFVRASDIGITIAADGTMEFDSSEFEDAINEDYNGVLELLGAAATGNSSSNAVQFYACSEKYTTAGTYHVKVVVDSNDEIVSAQIKLADEDEWRDAASWNGNVIYFDSTFEEGEPVYPENSLQLTVTLEEGVYGTDTNPVVIHVKQGLFGALEDILEEMVGTDGLLDTSEETIEDKIDMLQDKIDNENNRLERVEERLTAKFARLETMLAEMEQQQSAVAAMLGYY